MGAGHWHPGGRHSLQQDSIGENTHPDEATRRRPRRRSTSRRTRTLLALVLLPLALVTVLLLVALWPSGAYPSSPNPYKPASGASVDTGTVVAVEPAACSGGKVDAAGTACLLASTQPDAGGEPVKVLVNPEVSKDPGVRAGEKIRYLNLSGAVGGARPDAAYVFIDFVRTAPLALIAGLYALVVVLVARWRGVRALAGLLVSYTTLALFVLPALLEGKPALLVSCVGAAAMMFLVMYFTHGFSTRTSTALLGTLVGLAATAGLGAWATSITRLIGSGDGGGYQLQTLAPQVSIASLTMSSLMIVGLGILNDVTITQAAAVWELWELAPGTSARKLFFSAMRVGQDHIASTVYTIAFAYVGGALPSLLLARLYERPLMEALSSGELAGEIVRTVIGSTGLVLAIPATTALAVAIVKSGGGKVRQS